MGRTRAFALYSNTLIVLLLYLVQRLYLSPCAKKKKKVMSSKDVFFITKLKSSCTFFFFSSVIFSSFSTCIHLVSASVSLFFSVIRTHITEAMYAILTCMPFSCNYSSIHQPLSLHTQ